MAPTIEVLLVLVVFAISRYFYFWEDTRPLLLRDKQLHQVDGSTISNVFTNLLAYQWAVTGSESAGGPGGGRATVTAFTSVFLCCEKSYCILVLITVLLQISQASSFFNQASGSLSLELKATLMCTNGNVQESATCRYNWTTGGCDKPCSSCCLLITNWTARKGIQIALHVCNPLFGICTRVRSQWN